MTTEEVYDRCYTNYRLSFLKHFILFLNFTLDYIYMN